MNFRRGSLFQASKIRWYLLTGLWLISISAYKAYLLLLLLLLISVIRFCVTCCVTTPVTFCVTSCVTNRVTSGVTHVVTFCITTPGVCSILSSSTSREAFSAGASSTTVSCAPSAFSFSFFSSLHFATRRRVCSRIRFCLASSFGVRPSAVFFRQPVNCSRPPVRVSRPSVCSQATAFSTSVTGKWKQEAISGTDMGTPGTRQTALSGLAAAMASMQCHTPSTEAPSGSFIIMAVMFSRSFVTCAFWFSIKWYVLLSGDADSTPQKALPSCVPMNPLMRSAAQIPSRESIAPCARK